MATPTLLEAIRETVTALASTLQLQDQKVFIDAITTKTMKELEASFFVDLKSFSDISERTLEDVLQTISTFRLRGPLKDKLIPFVKQTPSQSSLGGPNTVQLGDDQLKRLAELVEEQNEAKKRRVSTTGFSFTAPLHEASNKQMAELLKEGATFREVDDLLTCEKRELVAALKWLNLHTKQVSLEPYQKHRKERADKVGIQEDNVKVRETMFYPLLLPIMQAAAAGQSDVKFCAQNYSQPAPCEDVIGFVGNVPKCPVEVKLTRYVSNGNNGDGIRANIEAFAGLARCLSKVAEDMEKSGAVDLTSDNNHIKEFLCVYAARVEAIHIAKIGFDFATHKIVSIVVGPKFPVDRDYTDSRLCDEDDFRIVVNTQLKNVLSPKFPPGFMSLVRLVDELRIIEKLPLVKLYLVYDQKQNQERELGEVKILHQGSKSVVFHEEGHNTCIKVSFAAIVEQEWKIHTILDAPLGHESSLRRGLAAGSVRGAGDGLRFIELEGFGESFRLALLQKSIADREVYWDQACSGIKEIHDKGYFHGDIKPENMLLINNKLVINDFDSCCRFSEIPKRMTNYYASPQVMNSGRTSYVKKDDQRSLLLSFLSLDFPWDNVQEKKHLICQVATGEIITAPYLQKAAEVLKPK